MVLLLTGDNTYQADEEIRRLIQSTDLQPEHVDGDSLDQARLADIMKGSSLFSEHRLVVITGLSSKSELWNLAAEWAPLVSAEITLILREVKPDKRTKAYKSFAKNVTVLNVTSWTEHQHALAEKWLDSIASTRNVTLSTSQVRDIVTRSLIPGERSGYRIIDQALIIRALEALGNLETVTDDAVDAVLPVSTTDAIFDLLEMATERHANQLRHQLDDLSNAQDGYQILAIVVTQWSQLLIIALGAAEDTADVHPFVRQKLTTLSRQFTRPQLRTLTQQLSILDRQTKSSSTSPWDALSLFLFAIAHR